MKYLQKEVFFLELFQIIVPSLIIMDQSFLIFGQLGPNEANVEGAAFAGIVELSGLSW